MSAYNKSLNDMHTYIHCTRITKEFSLPFNSPAVRKVVGTWVVGTRRKIVEPLIEVEYVSQ